MTGFGRGSALDKEWAVVVELTSLNKRSLEIVVSLPKEWQSRERLMVTKIRRAIARGKINVSLKIEPLAEDKSPLWDEGALLQTLHQLAALAEKEKIPFRPDATLLFQVASSQRELTFPPLPREGEALLEKALEEALAALLDMRQVEGEALARDIAKRAEALRQRLAVIGTETAEEVPRYRDHLLQRLRQLGLDLDLDDERLLKELALFADRCDISEEILRLESHLEQFWQNFASDQPVGRKLEFILQEIQREFNTIGAKTRSTAIGKEVIEAKNTIESMREQLQNVE